MSGWLTVKILLALAAFVCGVASANGKCPLWVAVILLSIFALLQVIPLG